MADILPKIEVTKKSFFDSPRVLRMVDAKTRKALSRLGAFIRQRAMTSIRTRKKPSNPGSPPSNHTGLLKHNIFFVYDDEKHSVVIGPARLNGKSGRLVPQLLEDGGDITVREALQEDGTWRPTSGTPRERLIPIWLAPDELRNAPGRQLVFKREPVAARGSKKGKRKAIGGGERTVTYVKVGGEGNAAGVRTRQAHLAARPYMGPAMRAELSGSRAGAMWAAA